MSAEYVDDVPYIRQYVADLAPARLRLVAALNGVSPPAGDDFNYCELGCGHGDTIAALAAAHPNARFLGIDINAEHIASAKKLAKSGALENIGFLQRDFESLIDEDIGELDFITAHGVLSWVGPDKGRALMELARRKLRPGGLLHVSYNAMPGWSALEPLRQLLLSPIGDQKPRADAPSTLERAEMGIGFAEAMRNAGAEYFRQNASSSEMLTTMRRAGLPYVVHEYMHEHWRPMYFAHVAWEMRERELHFVGVLPAYLNYRDLAMPPEVLAVLANVTDRITFESMKDYAINEFFRNDIYVAGKVARAAATTDAYLDRTPWHAIDSALTKDRSIKLPHRTVSLVGPAFDALFSGLSEGSVEIASFAETPAGARIGLEALRAAMIKLIVTGHVMPLLRPTSRHVPNLAARYVLPSVYNRMMIGRVAGDAPLVMTSPISGSAFPISALDAVAIRVLTEVAPDARAQWVDDFVARSVVRLRVGDEVVEDEKGQRAAIMAAIEKLTKERLATYVELGILTPRSAAHEP